ncbi:MAG: phage major capsid protein, partial [Acinetobacter sp.]|uniref:phage major capsid protein n=1 Tax=Acinetobacter sp. TaxID=472 RepID=UPI000FBA8C19
MDKIKLTRETIAAKEAEFRRLMEGELTDEVRGQLDNLYTEMATLQGDLKRYEQAEEIAKRSANPVIPGATHSNPEQKEIAKRFSFGDVLKAGRGERAEGFLKEMHEEGVKELKERGLSAGEGVVLPTMVLQSQTRAAQVVGTNNVGGYLVETVNSGGIIEFLGERLVLANMGVMTLDNLTGNVNFPSGTTGLTMTWEGETDDAAETNETFGQVAYTPNRLAGYTDMSKQLIAQGNPSISNYLSLEVRKAFARAIQKAAIHGNGSGIDGIVGTSGIGSVAIGTNGGAPTWTMITNLYRELAVDNADEGSLYYLTNAKVIAKMQQTPKQSSGVEGNFLLNGAKDSLNSLPVAVTNAVSSALTKGTSSGVCSALICG